VISKGKKSGAIRAAFCVDIHKQFNIRTVKLQRLCIDSDDGDGKFE